MSNVLPRTERPDPISHEVVKHNRPFLDRRQERAARRAARNSRRSRIAAQRAMLVKAEYDLKNTTIGQAVDIIDFSSQVVGDVLLMVEEYGKARKDVLGYFPGRPSPTSRKRFERALRERAEEEKA